MKKWGFDSERKTAKQAWDKLKIIYEVASKVKESKLQTYKGQFKILKMKEEENTREPSKSRGGCQCY